MSVLGQPVVFVPKERYTVEARPDKTYSAMFGEPAMSVSFHDSDGNVGIRVSDGHKLGARIRKSTMESRKVFLEGNLGPCRFVEENGKWFFEVFEWAGYGYATLAVQERLQIVRVGRCDEKMDEFRVASLPEEDARPVFLERDPHCRVRTVPGFGLCRIVRKGEKMFLETLEDSTPEPAEVS